MTAKAIFWATVSLIAFGMLRDSDSLGMSLVSFGLMAVSLWMLREVAFAPERQRRREMKESLR